MFLSLRNFWDGLGSSPLPPLITVSLTPSLIEVPTESLQLPQQVPLRLVDTLIRVARTVRKSFKVESDSSRESPAELHYLMTLAWDLADEILWNEPFGALFFSVLINHNCVVSSIAFPTTRKSESGSFLLPLDWQELEYTLDVQDSPFHPPQIQCHYGRNSGRTQNAPGFKPRALLLWG